MTVAELIREPHRLSIDNPDQDVSGFPVVLHTHGSFGFEQIATYVRQSAMGSVVILESERK